MERDPEALERARRRQSRTERVQRRRLALGVVVLGLIVLIVALAVGLSGGKESASTTTSSTSASNDDLVSGTYSAKLTGVESVPSVNTTAAGTLILTYDSKKKELSFVLEITHALTNPSVATIYQGTAGAVGAAVYTLYVADQANQGKKLGILAQGVIAQADLIGPLLGGTIADLIQLIKDGNAYVSVGNTSHPVDAIRGQID
jgi:MFS family permease